MSFSRFLVVFLSVLIAEKLFSQGMGISESSITPEATAILELRSIERGFLVPRLTTAQRDNIIISIGIPATSLLIFNTTTNQYNYYDGAA